MIEAGQYAHLEDAGNVLPAVYRYLARQPILDANQHVVAYELLFRTEGATLFQGDGEWATRTMLDNTVLFGLRELTNGLPAFVNCTAETLLGDQIRVLPKESTVLEILENIDPTPAVLAACRRLKHAGYRLALDDFVYRPELEPLIEIADYIKIDLLDPSSPRLIETLEHLTRFRGALLAEKVENPQAFQRARTLGFTLFQGYHFCRPVLVKNRKIPANRMGYLRLLKLLQAEPLDIEKVCDIVKSEPSLAYRLLRYVNSPVHGLREPVTSLQSALLQIGDDQFRRIATLAVTTELGGSTAREVLRMALVRARFCEMTSSLCGVEPTEQYVLGLFSLLPAILLKPMDELLRELGLAKPIQEALLGAEGPRVCPLQWIEAHERGDFMTSDSIATAHGLNSAIIGEQFTRAALWADQLLSE